MAAAAARCVFNACMQALVCLVGGPWIISVRRRASTDTEIASATYIRRLHVGYVCTFQPQHQPSLFRDPTIPALARWGLPVLLLANDALLLYSNIGDGATVHLRVFDGQGQAVDSAPLYAITLGHSIQDMWNAKAYFTSVLIAGTCCDHLPMLYLTFFLAPGDRYMLGQIHTYAPTHPHSPHTVFSGAWPHIKSLIAFLCWILDGRRLGQDARRALLTLAYVMQKLSHIEVNLSLDTSYGCNMTLMRPIHSHAPHANTKRRPSSS